SSPCFAPAPSGAKPRRRRSAVHFGRSATRAAATRAGWFWPTLAAEARQRRPRPPLARPPGGPRPAERLGPRRWPVRRRPALRRSSNPSARRAASRPESKSRCISSRWIHAPAFRRIDRIADRHAVGLKLIIDEPIENGGYRRGAQAKRAGIQLELRFRFLQG